MSKILRFWFPVGLYSAIIFYVSSRSHVSQPVKIGHFDKGLHFFEYLIFGFLMAYALNNTKSFCRVRDLKLWAGIWTALYAASDEIHQFFVPGRTLDVLDFIFDVLGGWAGVYLYLNFTHQGVKEVSNNNQL